MMGRTALQLNESGVVKDTVTLVTTDGPCGAAIAIVSVANAEAKIQLPLIIMLPFERFPGFDWRDLKPF